MKRLLSLLALPLWMSCSTPLPTTYAHQASAITQRPTMTSSRALLVLDMQNDFCHASGKLHGLVQSELDRTGVVARTVQLAEAALANGVLTILSPIQFDYSQPPATTPEGIAASIAAVQGFDRAAFGGALIDELGQLAEHDGALVMPKPSLSAFAGTPLKSILDENGIEEIVIAGLLTNLCVENTARDAFDLGYRVRVVGDSTVTFDSAQHDHAVKTIFPMLGKVITAAEFTESVSLATQ